MTDLHVAIGRSGTRFTLLAPVLFADEGVTVPVGFRCDFASVPRALWFWLPPLGYYQAAALLHDWFYACHRAGMFTPTRAEVDRMFLRQMRRDGVGWRTRWIMYLAVRLGGHGAWRTP